MNKHGFLDIFTILIHLVDFLLAQYHSPHVQPGRTTMVHLFEWKWIDIAEECERYLAPNGYAAVQISPPQEHRLVQTPFRPWWQRYQPSSFKLKSRSGNADELASMIRRCNNVGVRIYVDAVINHMAGGAGIGSDGTNFNSYDEEYPLGFSRKDFNDDRCSHPIKDWLVVYEVRYCRLSGMPDLKHDRENVQTHLINYLNKLISLGIAGFRIDAAKHIWPVDLENIIKKLHNLREDIFGKNARAFIYSEVIDTGNEPIKNTEYVHLGRVTEFRYGIYLSDASIFSQNFGSDWGMVTGGDAVVFVDNHDTQRGLGFDSRVLTFFEPKKYKISNAFMLAWPYGFVQLMSSYRFDKIKTWQGPPSETNGETKNVRINFDGSCKDGWMCEHRWREIKNMVEFRNIALFEGVANWYDNDNNQIAFSRGNKAFIAINNDDYIMDIWLFTGLPEGEYCDIISGNILNNICTGKVIKVHKDGKAKIIINHTSEVPIIAIHTKALARKTMDNGKSNSFTRCFADVLQQIT